MIERFWPPAPVKEIDGVAVDAEMLEWRDRWGRTAVHWAVLNGHVACLRALLAVWPLTKLVLLWYQG